MDKVYVVLAYYTDGSGLGAETVLCVFRTAERAERFKILADKLYPSKEIVVVERELEP